MIFGIENFETYAVIGILFFFGFLEALGGLYSHSDRTKDDWMLEVWSFFQLSLFIKPGIVLFILLIGTSLFPSVHYLWQDWSLWLALPFYIFIDDLLQYWYHRKAHEWPWLWKLHRPHHAAEELGVFTAYRNAALYYVLMPNIWWIGLMTFMGLGHAIVIGLIFKQLVVIGAHSEIRWDRFLYNNKWLHPLAWIVERTISTPATHFAHHGKSARDGISDPNGNFSNTFFFWDLMFGTAMISRQYPLEYGLENDPKDSWVAHMYYPFVKSAKAGSQIGKDYERVDTTQNVPITLELEAGKYLYCQCGFSKNQPFCDGSHHGTGQKPLLFEVKKKSKLRLCRCKKTQNGPFCDESHLTISK